MPKPITEDALFYGDNLPVLQSYIPDESVSLCYLDPPFNSRRAYNILFRDESGEETQSQLRVFDDSWHWNNTAEQTYQALLTEAPPHVSTMIAALRSFIGTNQMTAYLVMMAIRLVELHRVLKSTGSLYLHCDPTASHYLKILLDAIFGGANFVNEIIWKRTTTKSDFQEGAKNWPRVHDVILHYARDSKRLAVFQQPFSAYSDDYVEKIYRHRDNDGRRFSLDNLAAPGAGSRGHPQYEFMGVTRFWRYSKEKMERLLAEGRIVQTKPGAVPRYKRYLDEMRGVAVGDIWTDISPIGAQAAERLGYPTQKPVALLERIIQASSNPGDWVLDPFCGCGTAVVAAEKLGRRWLGIDISHLAITLVRARLRESFPAAEFRVIGEPEDLGAARQLANDNRWQFEAWALSLVHARPVGSTGGEREGKKGRDRGIDGVIVFVDEPKGKPKRALVQVKSGHVSSRDVRDLRGTVEREGAAIGVFITLEPPTREMTQEATVAGVYRSPGWNRDYPRIQILTIAELLGGAEVAMPPTQGTFKQAQRIVEEGEQPPLL